MAAATPSLHPTARASKRPLVIGGQDHRHCLRMDRFDHRVRRCREKTIDLIRAGYRLRLRAAITIERRPDASEGEQWPSWFEANQTTSFLLVSGFGSGADHIVKSGPFDRFAKTPFEKSF
jgi:hypothetical protein